MYLGPNKKTKGEHYFYDPKVCKLLTRRKCRRIQGIPPEWRQNKSITLNDIDEDVHGSDNYDVLHEGAKEDSIEQLPESIMELEPLEELVDAPGVK